MARILDGDPKAAADILSDLIADWGDAAPTALADLGRHGLPGDYRLLARFDDPLARQTFVKVPMAQADERGALRSQIGDDVDVVDSLLRYPLAPIPGEIDHGNINLVIGPGTGGGGRRIAPLPWTHKPVPSRELGGPVDFT